MKKVKWGILSTAKIALEKGVPGMLKCPNSEVIAIGSRNEANARKAAERFGIGRFYGSYEELLSDPLVEAVYNPLPNHLHLPWTIRALQAGKHVLCEKPIALNAAEALQLKGASEQFPNLKLMEAFMYRHSPQWQFTLQKLKEGAIGELRNIHSIFTYFNTDPNNIRNQKEIGGGGLMDIGCYCISLSRWLFGRQPARVMSLMEFDPVMHTDRLTSALLDFGNGTSLFTCGTQLAPFQRTTILGTHGAIEIEIPFNAPPDRPTRLWTYSKQGRNEISFETHDQYTLQCQSFSQSILDGAPVFTPIDDAVGNMKVIEAVVDSAHKNQWVELV